MEKSKTSAPRAHETDSPKETELTLSKLLRDGGASPTLVKSSSSREEAAWRKTEALSTFYPTLTIGMNRLLDKQYMLIDIPGPGGVGSSSLPQVLPTTNYTLTANWTIFEGGGIFKRYEAARSLETSSEYESEWVTFRQIRDITLHFYRALTAKLLKEVAEQNVKTLSDHLAEAKLFKSQGLTTNYDVLRVEVQLSDAQAEVLNSQDNEAIAILKLSDLTGQDYHGFTLRGDLPVVQAKTLNLNFEARRDLKAFEKKSEALDELASAAGKHWSPKLNLYGQYQHYNNSSDSWMSDFRDARSIGLQVTWNLFEGGAAVARAHESLEQKIQAEQSLIIAKQKAHTDIEIWNRKLKYFTTVYNAKLTDVAKSTESSRLARVGRKAGARTNTDLLDAEAELFRARASLVNAQMGAIEALIQLELSTGQNLYEFIPL